LALILRMLSKLGGISPREVRSIQYYYCKLQREACRKEVFKRTESRIVSQQQLMFITNTKHQ